MRADPPRLRGRSAEFGTVLDALRSVQRGRCVVVLVRGEPGIGKTALVNAIVEQAGSVSAPRIRRPGPRIRSLRSPRSGPPCGSVSRR